MQLNELNVLETAAGIREKKFSATEVFEACLKQAVKCDSKLSALITTTIEKGQEQARLVDAQIAKGENPGLLAGVPVVLKDNICTHGVRTTAASSVLGQWCPPYDATVWELLRGEGAVMLGKANMDEFAMGSSSESSAFGPTANPWDITRIPGGSSGGSAAAVAAGYAPFSLGSDTGGSIRQPAAFCGLYGLKPTYGMVSRYGVIAYASSLDQIGPFARTSEDLALLMKVLAKHDLRDSSCIAGKNIDFNAAPADFKGKRVALVKDFQGFSLNPAIAAAIKQVTRLLSDAGAEVVEVELPVTARYAVACYYAIAITEANTNLARYDGVRYGYSSEGTGGIKEMFEAARSKGFGSEVKSRIIAGTSLAELSRHEKYYTAATKVRTLVAEEFARAFSKTDFILQPVNSDLPPKIGDKANDTVKGYESDLYTLPVNLAGLPGLTFFTGYADSGLPVGLQLIAPRWGDSSLISAAMTLEKLLGSPRIAAGGI